MDILFNNINLVSNAIGWSLIHFIWQGLIIFICYWIVTRIFFKSNYLLKYWSGMFFILLSIFFPIREVINQLQIDNITDISLISQINNSIEFIEINGILNPTEIFLTLIQKSLPYLVSLWLFAIALISFNLTKSWFTLLKISKQTDRPTPAHLIGYGHNKSNLLNLKFQPIITLSKDIIIPATFGFFKPVILLPVSIIYQLPQEQIEAIILHELCHIKRADFVHNILQIFVETLFFYHPIIKWMSQDIRKTREQCCDELVLKLNTRPLVYAKALTNIASLLNKKEHDKPLSSIQVAATDGELFNRIRRLMIKKDTKIPLPIISLGLIGLLLLYYIVINFSQPRPPNLYNKPVNISNNLSQDNIYFDRPSYNIPNIETLRNTEQNRYKISQVKIKNQNQNQNQNFKNPLVSEKTNNNSIVLTQTYLNITDINPLTPLITGNKSVSNPHVMDQRSDDSSSNKTSFEKKIKQAQDSSILLPLKPQANNLSFKLPKNIKKVLPSYNRTALAMNTQGTVILSFKINKKGRVKDIKIDKKSKSNYLDSISKQALRLWRFDVKSLDSTNISHRYQQIFHFNLKDRDNRCSTLTTGSRIHHKQCKYKNT